MPAERRLAVIRRLPTTVDAPRLARDAAADMLGRLGAVARRRANDVALSVSELVTNAVMHGPAGELELRLSGTPSLFRVEVADSGTEPFVWPATGSDAQHGLDLVGIFSDRAGSHEPTTVAWCEFDLA